MCEINSPSQNVGWIYCLTNPCMPGLVKVGMTKSQKRLPSIRASELFTTGVPVPFIVALEKMVINPVEKETSLHNLLSKYSERINNGREFFKTPVETVKDFFDLIDGVEKKIVTSKTQITESKTIEFELATECDVVKKYWSNYPEQKQQLIEWKIEYNKKARNPDINGKRNTPSTTAESGSLELKAANLRQRIRARQATPKCWPQKEDDLQTTQYKENMIAKIVGGRWFDRN